jgi:hypothetical protein
VLAAGRRRLGKANFNGLLRDSLQRIFGLFMDPALEKTALQLKTLSKLADPNAAEYLDHDQLALAWSPFSATRALASRCSRT